MSDKVLQKRIEEILAPHPEAMEFVLRYWQYCHAVDDIIDDPECRQNNEKILASYQLAADVFSCPFYRENVATLRPVEFMVNNTYADSVIWENPNNERWKQRDSQALRHVGIDMFLITVSICCDRETMRKISSEMRTYSHLKHMKEEGKDETS